MREVVCGMGATGQPYGQLGWCAGCVKDLDTGRITVLVKKKKK